MALDKLEFLQNALKMMLKHAEYKLAENEEQIKSKADDDEVTEEFITLGMYDTYLLGVQKTLEMVIKLLEGDTIDNAIEKIEAMMEDVAKA